MRHAPKFADAWLRRASYGGGIELPLAESGVEPPHSIKSLVERQSGPPTAGKRRGLLRRETASAGKPSRRSVRDAKSAAQSQLRREWTSTRCGISHLGRQRQSDLPYATKTNLYGVTGTPGRGLGPSEISHLTASLRQPGVRHSDPGH